MNRQPDGSTGGATVLRLRPDARRRHRRRASRLPDPRRAPRLDPPRRARRPSAGTLLAALAALLVLAGLAWLVFASGLLAVRAVTVEGTGTVSPDEVRARVGVVTGVPLARVDTNGLEAAVEAIPRVADARVERRWPRTLTVVVTERTPVAVRAEGGRFAVLDPEGVVLDVVPRRPPGLPLVLADAALPDALVVAASLPGSLAAQVDTVTAAGRDEVRLRLGDGREVIWGDAEASSRKASVLEVLLAREPGAEVYDLSAPDAPTTRR